MDLPISTFCFNGFRCDVTKMEDVVSLYDEAEEHFKDKVLFKNKIKDKISWQIFNTPVVPSKKISKKLVLIFFAKRMDIRCCRAKKDTWGNNMSN